MATYTYTLNGKTYSVLPNNYMQDFETTKEVSEQQAATKKQQLTDTLNSNNASTNKNYDNSARQAYIKYMQNKKALPSSLQAMGVNGGASETALMNLYNNYGTTRSNNEIARNSELGTNANNFNDTWNEYENNRLSELESARLEAVNNQRNAYQNEIELFSSTVQQYPSTRDGYNSYKNWISELEKLSLDEDPLRDTKIAMVKQQMAVQFPNGKPSSGNSGGSSGGGGYYSSGTTEEDKKTKGGGNTSKVNVAKQVQKTVKASNQVNKKSNSTTNKVAKLLKAALKASKK